MKMRLRSDNEVWRICLATYLQKISLFGAFLRDYLHFSSKFFFLKKSQKSKKSAVFWLKNRQFSIFFQNILEYDKTYWFTLLVQILGYLDHFWVIYSQKIWLNFFAHFFLRKVRPNCSDELRVSLNSAKTVHLNPHMLYIAGKLIKFSTRWCQNRSDWGKRPGALSVNWNRNKITV